MTDTMTHSSKIPQCSKRQLLRKGVLNSLLVSALGLYVATTPPTFAMESSAGGSRAADSGNALAPTAHPSALDFDMTETETAGWERWIESQGKSMGELTTPTYDLESFRKTKFSEWTDLYSPQWNDFLEQHGPALLAREPYYHAGGAPEPLLQTLKSIQRIMFSMAGDGEGLAETGFRKFIDPWIRNKSSMSTKEKITRSLEFIDSWIRNNSMSTKKKLQDPVNSMTFPRNTVCASRLRNVWNFSRTTLNPCLWMNLGLVKCVRGLQPPSTHS